MSHDCAWCRFSRRVTALRNRLQDPADRALLNEIMDRMLHAEADLEYDEVILEEYRHRHGPLGLAEASEGMEKRRREKDDA